DLRPNPASDYLLVQLEGDMVLRNSVWEVINTQGAVVQTTVRDLSVADTQVRLDVRSLPPGVYTLRVRHEGQYWSGVFVKE
ncbi:MAG: T9SS type A sorting domain-containing protein, partial [Bacteroidetes bacterium]